mgnify:CR=1 FL=1
MIPRHLERKLRTAAEQYPVVLLTGPRQSGKTTLVRAVFPDHQYISLEDPDQRTFATEDPRGFLGRFEQAAVLDEAQRTPDLYFWRDSTGHEIDLLLDHGGELVPIEIKSGQTFASDYLQGLTYWRSLPDQAHARAALVYGGDTSYTRQGIAVLSWEHWE